MNTRFVIQTDYAMQRKRENRMGTIRDIALSLLALGAVSSVCAVLLLL